MPELPEVETIRLGLTPVLRKQTITKVLVKRHDLRQPIPKDFARRLTGLTINRLSRRAKYLLMHFEGQNFCLLIHLGMSGRLLVFAKDMPIDKSPHDHWSFEFKSGTRLVYRDPRRFGLALLLEVKDINKHRLLSHLGVEPFDKAFNSDFLEKMFKGKKVSIKNAIIDQKIIVGVGNIYASEVLFRTKLSPFKPSGQVSKTELQSLVMSLQIVLQEAIAAGGSTLKDHRRPSGELGYFQFSFKVYDREGLTCLVCKKKSIERVVQAGRSTFYCPHCQKLS